ncbi:hypothetical protein [Desulfoluna limicola]|uniref:hypothetical protein n=1 Tax=Desulfoluna limicola TaxID=2810562 RepID=UPI001F17DDC8|nr:hypothetical protein [Desulfoluna limicola]
MEQNQAVMGSAPSPPSIPYLIVTIQFASGGSLFEMSPENFPVASPSAGQSPWVCPAEGDAWWSNHKELSCQLLSNKSKSCSKPVCQTQLIKSGKSLAPGRAAGGNDELNGYI